jgi:hypothetical protein
MWLKTSRFELAVDIRPLANLLIVLIVVFA